jgi:hypothetical protein
MDPPRIRRLGPQVERIVLDEMETEREHQFPYPGSHLNRRPRGQCSQRRRSYRSASVCQSTLYTPLTCE